MKGTITDKGVYGGIFFGSSTNDGKFFAMYISGRPSHQAWADLEPVHPSYPLMLSAAWHAGQDTVPAHSSHVFVVSQGTKTSSDPFPCHPPSGNLKINIGISETEQVFVIAVGS